MKLKKYPFIQKWCFINTKLQFLIITKHNFKVLSFKKKKLGMLLQKCLTCSELMVNLE